MANSQNNSMLILLDRIGLAISFIRGPNVNNWVEGMMTCIDRHLANGIDPGDERLWATFVCNFETAFTNTTKVQNAHHKLMNIKMKGDTLDDYIAEFQHLRQAAGWGVNDARTLMLFKQGLVLGLHKAILEKTVLQLNMLDSWANTAQTQHALWAEIKASLQGAGTKPSQSKGQRWHAVLGQSRDDKGRWDKSQWHGVKREDRMEVDGAAVNALSTEEKQRLVKEGKCFTCKKTGHQS